MRYQSGQGSLPQPAGGYGGRALHPLAEHPLGRVDIRSVVCAYKNQPRLSVSIAWAHIHQRCETLPNVIQRGGQGPAGRPGETFRRQTFRSAQASLSCQNEMAALPRATPRSSQRSSQGQHTFACSATFQRTHHHPLDTTSITTRNVLCVTVWDHRGARAMASTRGFLNIQSLNELTYEKVSSASDLSSRRGAS